MNTPFLQALAFRSFNRASNLSLACKRVGGKAALGRMLGYRDGAYIGQMLRGQRPITDVVLERLLKHEIIADLFLPEAALVASPTPPEKLVFELGLRLQESSPETRNSLASKLSAFALAPDSADLQQSLIAMLSSGTANPTIQNSLSK